MTSIADRMINEGVYLPVDTQEEVAEQQDMIAWLVGHIDPTRALTLQDGDHIPERYVFDQDPAELGSYLRRTGQVPKEMMVQTVRMPAPMVWAEWKAEDCRVGVMIEEVISRNSGIAIKRLLVCAVMEHDVYGVVPWATLLINTRFPHNPDNGDVTGRPVWIAKMDLHSEEAKRVTSRIAMDVVSVLFMLTTPKVSEVRDYEPKSPKVQKARQQRGKLPLLEMRKVTINLTSGAPRYRQQGHVVRQAGPTTSELADYRKRLHRVTGHFRKYTRNRTEPKLTWVPQFWRGDAKLGVLLHERTVTANEELE